MQIYAGNVYMSMFKLKKLAVEAAVWCQLAVLDPFWQKKGEISNLQQMTSDPRLKLLDRCIMVLKY